jgi:hypothetical protein
MLQYSKDLVLIKSLLETNQKTIIEHHKPVIIAAFISVLKFTLETSSRERDYKKERTLLTI